MRSEAGASERGELTRTTLRPKPQPRTKHLLSLFTHTCMNPPTNDPLNNADSPVEQSPIAGADSVELIAQASTPSPSASTSADSSGSQPNGFVPIDPRFIPAQRLASFLQLIATTIGAMVVYLAMMLGDADRELLVLGAVCLPLICLLLLWSTIFWPQIEYRHIQWKLSDVGLEIRRGVLWKKETAIPWARAQHADVSQGPIQRLFEIGSLTIHTAGTKNSSVTIDGLAHHQAVQLRDEIIRQRKEQDVV